MDRAYRQMTFDVLNRGLKTLPKSIVSMIDWKE